MDANRLGIILIVSGDFKLQGTITDGDVRRAMLAQLDMDRPVSVLLERKSGTPYENPITASQNPEGVSHLELLQKHSILQWYRTDFHGITSIRLEEYKVK